MTTDVHLKYINEVYVKIEAEPGIVMELADAFTWYADGYKWSPRYKSGQWNGQISLVNKLTGRVYSGLAQQIKKFCDSRDYTFSFDDELCYENISEYELKEFIKTLGLPEKYEVRDYQFKSILKCIRSKRRTLESPTSSGKSLIFYILMRWYLEQGHKGLLIVPTVGLVSQMRDDFRDYGFEGEIATSIGGLSKDNDIPADVVISTWQSLNNGKKVKMSKAWYNQFGCIMGDECHQFKAMSLKGIMESAENCQYRFAATGTLESNPLNLHTILGLFGARYKSISTVELIDKGYASKLKIKCIVLKYPNEIKKVVAKMDYHTEIDFLVNYEPRNNYIVNLTMSLTGNKLVFFRMIDHGRLLHDKFKEKTENIFYVDGSVKGESRNIMRAEIENLDDAVLLGSLGTTSTGTSIKRLHQMIAAAPQKSETKVPQSIGRMLRLHESKDYATLYDIVDDCKWKTKTNFALRHFMERAKMYDREGFDYKIYNVKIK